MEFSGCAECHVAMRTLMCHLNDHHNTAIYCVCPVCVPQQTHLDLTASMMKEMMKTCALFKLLETVVAVCIEWTVYRSLHQSSQLQQQVTTGGLLHKKRLRISPLSHDHQDLDEADDDSGGSNSPVPGPCHQSRDPPDQEDLMLLKKGRRKQNIPKKSCSQQLQSTIDNENCNFVHCEMAPGHGENTPGHGEMAPGHGEMAPGHGEMAPGHGENTPGHGEMAPGHGEIAPVHGENTPGHTENTPRYGEMAPGYGENTPVHCGNTPVYGEMAPGHGENTPGHGEIAPVYGETFSSNNAITNNHTDKPPKVCSGRGEGEGPTDIGASTYSAVRNMQSTIKCESPNPSVAGTPSAAGASTTPVDDIANGPAGFGKGASLVGASMPKYRCGLCYKYFDKFESVVEHREAFHKDQPPRKVLRRYGRFPCNTCGRVFKERHHMNEHLRCVHRTDRPFPCTACARSFKRSSELKRHLRDVHQMSKIQISSSLDTFPASPQSRGDPAPAGSPRAPMVPPGELLENEENYFNCARLRCHPNNMGEAPGALTQELSRYQALLKNPNDASFGRTEEHVEFIKQFLHKFVGQDVDDGLFSKET